MHRPSRKPVSTTPQTTAPDLRPNKAEVDELVHKVSDLVSQSPEKASKVLEDWLKNATTPSKKKAA
ncbi:hypothetical protein EBZ37_06065 [bacterium]|nr:hypothetical protein [bacterium]